MTIWLPAGPDFRDQTVRTDTVEDGFKKLVETRSVADMLESIGVRKDTPFLASIDLRKWCPFVEYFSGVGDSMAMAFLIRDAKDYVELCYMDFEAPPDPGLLVVPGITGGVVSGRSPPRPGTFMEVTP